MKAVTETVTGQAVSQSITRPVAEQGEVQIIWKEVLVGKIGVSDSSEFNNKASNCENNCQTKKIKPKTIFGTKSKVAGPSNNKIDVEHKVSFSCGGSPCDWLEYGQEQIDKTWCDLDEEERK